jgi:hypothetical protein
MGGVCPMLAAHRCGGRTSFIAFARAWDRFAGVRRARRASARELAILEQQLTDSILAESGAGAGADAPAADPAGAQSSLAAAIADHQATARARRAREARAVAQPAFPPTPAEWLRARRARRDADGAGRAEGPPEREPA